VNDKRKKWKREKWRHAKAYCKDEGEELVGELEDAHCGHLHRLHHDRLSQPLSDYEKI